MTATGNCLQLRHTSFLPNQLGLGTLLTMIFAPSVEMRCDRKRKRYVKNNHCLIFEMTINKARH